MRGAHDGGARIGHAGHARFAEQADVVPLQGGLQEGGGVVAHAALWHGAVLVLVVSAGVFAQGGLAFHALGLAWVASAGWRACVVAAFMDFARQLGHLHGLQRLAQGVERVDALEVGAGGFGVFDNPVASGGGLAQGVLGQRVAEGHLLGAAKIQRRGHQQQPTFSGGRCHGLQASGNGQTRSAQHAAGANQGQADEGGGVVVVDGIEQADA